MSDTEHKHLYRGVRTDAPPEQLDDDIIQGTCTVITVTGDSYDHHIEKKGTLCQSRGRFVDITWWRDMWVSNHKLTPDFLSLPDGTVYNMEHVVSYQVTWWAEEFRLGMYYDEVTG